MKNLAASATADENHLSPAEFTRRRSPVFSMIVVFYGIHGFMQGAFRECGRGQRAFLLIS